MNRENVNQSDKAKKTMKKGVVAVLLAFTLVIGSFVVPVIPNGSNLTVAVVEAKSKKKDKKKPVIKFSGKTKITVEKNKSVKIPKTTAKDNKDGNVTKKISVTVKKGKKSYKSIATKIKKNKKVKFSSTGKYTVTYTVKDRAGNKATKKRYVTVVDKKKTTTTEATTQAPTSQTPTVEKPTTGIYQETVNGITYNITRDYDIYQEKIFAAPSESDKITLTIENDYENLYMNEHDGFTNDSQYLKFLGSIKATDENGNDISDNIIIGERAFTSPVSNGSSCIIDIYVSDNSGNSLCINVKITFIDFDNYAYDGLDELELISSNPLVYGERRSYNSNDQ